MESTAEEILAYWFRGLTDADAVVRDGPHFVRWFGKSPEIDAELRTRFLPLCELAASGGLEQAWGDGPRERLALVIALDQLPRHIYRGSARAFATDSRALAAAVAAIDDGAVERLQLIERTFLHLPFSHAEDATAQQRGVELAGRLVELARVRAPASLAFYEDALREARRLRDVVARFGRFPHRNSALGRTYTADEIEFLQSADSVF